MLRVLNTLVPRSLVLASLVLCVLPAAAETEVSESPDASEPTKQVRPLPEIKVRKEPLPEELRNVGIDEKLEAQIPLTLKFTDQNGKEVTLADYFNGDKPVIITLNYYRCPVLCGLQLNGFVKTLKDLKWTAGENFEILTVSFDPSETPQLAKLKQQGYIREYGRPSGVTGWNFLVGKYDPIRQLLDATGFRIQWNEQSQEWMHTAGLIVCTPDGRISRYLYGVLIDQKTLRLSLVEAADGKIGSPLDQILLFCYHYDAEAGSYAASIQNLMRATGVLTVLGLGTFLAILWRWEFRRRQSELAAAKGLAS